MKRLIGLLLFLGIVGIQVCFSQSHEVSGTVTDKSDGMSLPGVSVVVKSKVGVGTATDANGKFVLKVDPTDVLEFAFIGMQSVVVPVEGKRVINVELSSAVETLEEIIVVGYGTVKREAKTGSVASIGSDELTDVPATSFDKMLTGKLAGVSITSSSGQPGAGSNIRIRGTSSINAGNEPLYVVDGIPIMNGDQTYFTNTGNALATINPNDIESITVLKDAAAASVYGSRAANGVILITTKSGKEGKSAFVARAKFGVSWLANDNNFGQMNGAQLLEFQRDAIVNAGLDPDDPTGLYYKPYELLTRPQTNWMKHFTRLGKVQDYEINVQGGSSKTKFYTSLSYHNNEGIVYGVDFKKMQARINTDHELASKFKMGTRVNIAYTKASDVPMQQLYMTNPMFAGMIIQPWTPKYASDGTHNMVIPENSNTNPRAVAQYDDQWEKQYRFMGSMYLEWKPVKGLTFKSTNAAEMTFGEGRSYWAPETNMGEAALQTSNLQFRVLTTSNTASYDGRSGDHTFRVLAGQEAMEKYYYSKYLSSPNVDPNIPYPNTSTAEKDRGSYSTNTRTLMSVFGIFDYNYAARYFLQGSVRWDGSSLFGEDNKWGTFYSVGASWNVHAEKFMDPVNWLNLLKLRVSYGVNGNNEIAVYKQYGVYSPAVYNGVSGLRPGTPANNKLSWEKNKSWNWGMDFAFLDIFSGSLDVYTRKTEDMLLDKPMSSTGGFTSALQNVGSLRNTGVEFQLEAKIIDKNDWKWDVGFNIAHNRSKILELAGDEMISYTNSLGEEEPRMQHIVGEKLLTFYLKDYYGVNPSNGEALYRDENGLLTNDFNTAAYIKAGSPEPTYTGGFNSTASWRGLSLSALFEFKGGNKITILENSYLQADGAQMNMNQLKSATNYWRKPGDTACNPKPVAGTTGNSNSVSTTRWLQRGDYLRIKDVTLSYTLPKDIIRRIHLNNARVYVSGLNLYTFHDVNWWDPERGVDGMGLGVYPMTKTFVGGIEITF